MNDMKFRLARLFCKAMQEGGLLRQDWQTCFQQANVGTPSDFSNGSSQVYSVYAWPVDAMTELLWTNWSGQSNLPGTHWSYWTWAVWFLFIHIAMADCKFALILYCCLCSDQ